MSSVQAGLGGFAEFKPGTWPTRTQRHEKKRGFSWKPTSTPEAEMEAWWAAGAALPKPLVVQSPSREADQRRGSLVRLACRRCSAPSRAQGTPRLRCLWLRTGREQPLRSSGALAAALTLSQQQGRRWGRTRGQHLLGSHPPKDTVCSPMDPSEGRWSESPWAGGRAEVCPPCVGRTGQGIAGWGCQQGDRDGQQECHRIAKTGGHPWSSLDLCCPGAALGDILTGFWLTLSERSCKL